MMEIVVHVKNCLQGYVGFANEINDVIVVFRGTQQNSIQNWIEDLLGKQLALDYPGMREAMVSHWACINFWRSVPEAIAQGFCKELAQMCQISGMESNNEPAIPIYSARPDQVMKALKHVYNIASNKLKGKELELLLVILPDNNGGYLGHSIIPDHMFSGLGINPLKELGKGFLIDLTVPTILGV